MRFLPFLLIIICSIFLNACSVTFPEMNRPLSKSIDKKKLIAKLKNTNKPKRSDDLTLMMTFSGGGTRSSALSYGVLQHLRDTNITINGQKRRLLDEIDLISSVSGGSFTSAYYGLNAVI